MQEHTHTNPEEENFLPGMEKKNPFALPAAYFERLPGRIVAKMEAAEELKEFDTLAAINRKLVFTVPVNYFIASANLAEYRYELAAFPQLSAVKRSRVEELQTDYFADFEAKMAKRLLQNAELEEFAALNAIEKKNTFAVTPDYFDTVAGNVKEKYYAAERSRVPVFEKIWQFVFNPRVAVSFAAVVVIGIATVWNASQTDHVLPAGDCKTLACLEKNELLNEQTLRDFDDENLYDMVDVDALDEQLSGTDSLSVKKDAPDSIKKNNEKN